MTKFFKKIQDFHFFCKIATKIRADEIRAEILRFQNFIQWNMKGNFLLLGNILWWSRGWTKLTSLTVRAQPTQKGESVGCARTVTHHWLVQLCRQRYHRRLYRRYGISMLNIYNLKFAFYRFSFNCRLYTLKKATKIRADEKGAGRKLGPTK